MRTRARQLSFVVGVGALCAGLGLARSGAGQPRSTSRAPDRPSAVASYRAALLSWLPPEADRRLGRVDVRGTETAPATAIAFQAADHSVRRFAPMALEVIGKQGDATRLRRLAPLTNPATATRALGQIRMTIRSIESGMGRNPGARDGATLGALQTALRNVQLAIEVSRGAGARADDDAHRTVQGTSLVAHYAMDAGVSASRILDACTESLHDIVAVLRPPDAREGSVARRPR